MSAAKIFTAAKCAYLASGNQSFSTFRKRLCYALSIRIENDNEAGTIGITDEDVLLCLRFLAGDFKKPKTSKGRGISKKKKASNYDKASQLLYPGLGKPKLLKFGLALIPESADTAALHVRIVSAMFNACKADVDKRFSAAESSDYFDEDAVADAVSKWEWRAECIEGASGIWEEVAMKAKFGDPIEDFMLTHEELCELDCE